MGTMTDEDVNKIFLERHSRLLMRGKPVTYDNSKNPFKIVAQSLQFKSMHILDDQEFDFEDDTETTRGTLVLPKKDCDEFVLDQKQLSSSLNQ